MLRELMSLPHANATTSPRAFERTASSGSGTSHVESSHAHLAAVRNDAPPGGLEEELRPVALVDVLVDRFLRRLLDARLTAPEIRDPGRPDLLRFRRTGELDLGRIELGADDRAETRTNSIEREPEKCVEGQRIQIPEMLVAPQSEKGPAFTLYAEE